MASSDVEANHACNIERISDEKLFYLRSRGVGRENALAMMIEAELRDMYRCYLMIDSVGYEQLLEKILKKIQ
ncbi:MAG: SufD family Fe-S cluster assembly protein [Candidatus Peribacteria bacterium]|nr:MAG: SufD family Fe-S cluster assembly protein [Candidatus Peribacteria bacterium]